MSRRLILIAVVFIGILIFRAEFLLADGVLTLKSALDLNLKNSSKRAIGKQKIIEKQSLRLEKQAVFIPRLSLNVADRNGETNLKAQGISFPGAPDKIGPFSTFDARLTFNETLLNLNFLNQLQAADEDVRVSELELNQTESEALYQTAILYLNSRKADSSVSADLANVKLSEELLKFAEHEKESGVGTVLDVTRAMVKLSEDRQKLVSAMTQKEDSFLILQNQLGIPQGEALVLDDRSLPDMTFPDIKESLQIALNRRKELAYLSQKEKVKEIQLKAASQEKYPSINLFADYGEIGNGINDSFPTHNVGIALNWPLYDGEIRKSHEMNLMSQIQQEKAKRREVASQVELEVRQIYNDFNAVKKELDLAHERLSLAEKELSLSEHRFKSGVGTHIELIKSQTSLAEAREAMVEAQYALQAGILKYFFVTGQMDEFYSRLF